MTPDLLESQIAVFVLSETMSDSQKQRQIMQMMDECLIDFFKYCEKYHFINPTGNYEKIIADYKQKSNGA